MLSPIYQYLTLFFPSSPLNDCPAECSEVMGHGAALSLHTTNASCPWHLFSSAPHLLQLKSCY